jgi:hypothetical protein
VFHPKYSLYAKKLRRQKDDPGRGIALPSPWHSLAGINVRPGLFQDVFNHGEKGFVGAAGFGKWSIALTERRSFPQERFER